MQKIFKRKLTDEHVLIAKYIFKGYTNSQIANRINCSKSGVSYKISALFAKYNAKSRIELITNIFAQIINNNKEKIKNQEEIIMYYENKIENFKKIITGLIKNRNKNENFKHWCLEAKKYF